MTTYKENTTMTKNWTMNETQKAFIETLKAMGGLLRF